ncbi:MAG: SpoIIE family protein phosphatase [Deltaproteobacteria bacterium]
MAASLSAELARPLSEIRIGFLVEALSDTYWQELVLAVDGAARRRGVRLFVFIGGTLDAPEIAARQANRGYQLPSLACVDGLIVAPLGSCAGPERLAQYFQRYHPMPMSALSLVFDQVPSVCTDNVQSMQDAVSHLIVVHGVRRVAFLRGPRLNAEAELRYRGYLQALSQHGIALDPALVLQGDFSDQSGMRVIRELDSTAKPPFEALVAANDSMALGALSELSSRGIRVPEQVLVFGFDDVPEGRWAKPSLSTLRQPLPSLADAALSHVLDQLAGRTPSPLTLIAGELVPRESCGCRSLFDSLGKTPAGRPSRLVPPESPNTQRQLIEVALVELELHDLQPGGSEQLPQSWRSELATSFAQEVNGGEPRGLGRLGELLVAAAGSGRELGDWQRVVSALQRCVPLERRAAVDPLLYRYRVCVGDAAERQQAARRIRSEAMLQQTIAAGSDVLGFFSLRAMFDALSGHLPRMGMRGCFVALYEPSPLWPPHESRLIFAYRDGARVPLPEQGVLFPTRELAPSALLPKDPRTWTVSTLFFGDNPLGLLLFELGPPQGQIYEWLREQISVALEGARLIRRVDEEVAERERAERQRLAHELSLAARIQASVLPQKLQAVGLEISASMVPATEVGGDCYDVLPFAGGAWLSIGDVAGHGLGPGVVMMMLQSSVAAVLRADPEISPAAALEVVNAVLFENLKQRLQQGEYATLMLLRYESSGRIRFAGAHEEPLVYRARSGRCELLPAPGLWVGIKPSVRGQMPESEVVLEPDDVLLLYTDGAVEARNANRQQYGVQRLASELEAVHGAPVEQIRDHLLLAVQGWMDKQRDDITLVVARQVGA